MLCGVAELPRLTELREHVEYLDREISRLSAARRRQRWRAARATPPSALTETAPSAPVAQTKASFEYQWEHMPAGRALPSDAAFMRGLAQQLPDMVQVPREWFAGKTVVDVGCGIGRYTYGLLALGARVTACDQSDTALRRTAELCRPFADRLSLDRIDLLAWDGDADFDLAFCFGVVHHTGNTYLAMENVCRKVRPGGRVFFMIYAVPQTLAAFREINEYERLADEMRELPFDERRTRLERRFGAEAAHGWFDATSPRINDRLTFEEIHDVLTELGFTRITGRLVARNHYVVAERLDLDPPGHAGPLSRSGARGE
jgi:SAM-dependent methyltransferase